MNPGMGLFVQEPLEGRAAEQVPITSAFESNTEASQLSTRSMRVSGVCEWRGDGGHSRQDVAIKTRHLRQSLRHTIISTTDVVMELGALIVLGIGLDAHSVKPNKKRLFYSDASSQILPSQFTNNTRWKKRRKY